MVVTFAGKDDKDDQYTNHWISFKVCSSVLAIHFPIFLPPSPPPPRSPLLTMPKLS